MNVHENPLVAGPVFFSHPLDFQSFQPNHDSATPQFEGIHHVGPPSINVEVKLLGVNDSAVEAGADPVGEVCLFDMIMRNHRILLMREIIGRCTRSIRHVALGRR